jgi:hypothetical protein
VHLPDRGGACTIMDVRATIQALAESHRPSLPVRALFGLRRLLGRLFRWDAPEPEAPTGSGVPSPSDLPLVTRRWLDRIDPADLERSGVPAGTKDGAFTVLYVHDREAVSAIRNRTVEAFLVLALDPSPGGHDLILAIHVRPVSAWTRPYMALIDPFRRWIVYPSLLGQLHDAWSQGVGRDREFSNVAEGP